MQGIYSDGKSLRYDPEKVIKFGCETKCVKQNVTITGVVYSVGEDLIDQGGSTKNRHLNNITL